MKGMQVRPAPQQGTSPQDPPQSEQGSVNSPQPVAADAVASPDQSQAAPTALGDDQAVEAPRHPKLAPPLPPASNSEAMGSSDMPSDEIAPSEEEPRPSAVLGVLKTIFSWIILPGLIVLFLHSFVFQAFYVSGSSMNPDFQDGDYLIIDKVGFTISNIKSTFGLDTSLDLKRGDVLVFRYPNNLSTFFIKRLIGLPGDRVVVKDGRVTIYNNEHPEGLVLTEPYIDPSAVTQGDIDEVVEKNKYFVMGDNREPNGSFDSREWGQLPREDIVGVATARLLPINELGPLKHPTY
jgi:signal peptidase I